MILITTTNFAYGQTNQTIFNNANPVNIKNIPVKKVHVGDIDIAYKTFGKGLKYRFKLFVDVNQTNGS